MKETVTLRVIPRIAATPTLLVREVAKQLHINENRVVKVDIVRRSIDARQRQVMVGLTVNAHIDHIDETPLPGPKEYRPVADDALKRSGCVGDGRHSS